MIVLTLSYDHSQWEVRLFEDDYVIVELTGATVHRRVENLEAGDRIRWRGYNGHLLDVVHIRKIDEGESNAG